MFWLTQANIFQELEQNIIVICSFLGNSPVSEF